MALNELAHSASFALPALVGVAIAALPLRMASARRMGFLSAVLVMTFQTWLFWSAAGELELDWVFIPSFGSRWHFLTGRLGFASGAAVCWVAVAATAHLSRDDSSQARLRVAGFQWVLAGALGILGANDALVFLFAWGVVMVGSVLGFGVLFGPSARLAAVRKFVSQQLIFALLMVVLVIVCGAESERQTGFAGFEFSRIRSLVWYPHQERWLFWLGFVGFFGLAGLFPLHRSWRGLWHDSDTTARLLLVVHAGLVAPLWLSRWLVELSPSVSREWSIGIASVFTVHLVAALRRGVVSQYAKPEMVTGFMVLICLGMVSFDAPAVSFAWLGMLHLLVLSVSLESLRVSRRLEWMLWVVAFAGLPGLWGGELLRSLGMSYWARSPFLVILFVVAWTVIVIRTLSMPAAPASSSGSPPWAFARVASAVGLAFLALSLWTAFDAKQRLETITERQTDRLLSPRFPDTEAVSDLEDPGEGAPP